MRFSSKSTVLVTLLLFFVSVFCFSKASFESQCVVEGTIVDFYCYEENAWKINFLSPAAGTVNFIIGNETRNRDIMQVIANQNYIHQYGNVSLIHCVKNDHSSLFAALLITDEEQEFFPMVTPETWTSLSLEWETPTIYNYSFVDYAYNVTLIGRDGHTIETRRSVFSGNEIPSMEVDLSGYECEPISIELSLPGNCQPARIPVTLLIDPPYPQPQGLKAVLLNTTSFALTWTHPDMYFNDHYFNYLVSVEVVSTGHIISRYTVNLESTTTPWEEIDLRGRVDESQEINFTLSLVGDCREFYTVAFLPIFPVEFSSEVVDVAALFTGDLNLQKVEVMFNSPQLCLHQTASYTLTFTSNTNDGWVTESRPLGTASQMVKEEIAPEKFQLESSYTVTVTIETVLGHVSSSAIFNTCTLFGGAPRTLRIQSMGHNKAHLSWEQICSASSPLPVTYVITAMLVDTGDRVYDQQITLQMNEPHSLLLSMEEYACRAVNYTVMLYGQCQGVSIVEALSAYPTSFGQNVTVETSFNNDGTFKRFEIDFIPPQLCDFQSSSYILSYTDGSETWLNDPVIITDTSRLIREEIYSGIEINTEYTVTVTVITDFGNLSSNATIDPLCPQPRALKAVLSNSTSFVLTWTHPDMYFNDKYFNYSVSVVVVSTGRIISQYTVNLESTATPWEEIDLRGRVEECQEINFTLSLVGDCRELYTVAILPIYPTSFGQNVTVEASFNNDGTFKKLEIEFIPPRLCEFQSSSYILSYSNGSETWSNDPVIITDTSRLIREEIDSGIEINTEYTATVTVITDFGNLSSNASIRPSQKIQTARTSQRRQTTSSDYQMYIMTSVLVAALVFSFIAGVTVLYCLRQRKRKKEKLRVLSISAKMQGPMVQNPLYESTEDHYEHLPDCSNGRPPPSLTILPATPTSLDNPGQPNADITPQLPPPRKNSEAGPLGEKPSLLGNTERSPKQLSNKHIPDSQSMGGMSAHSGEDCYTIMSPAGTLTMLPRTTSSVNPTDSTCNGLGTPVCSDATCVDEGVPT